MGSGILQCPADAFIADYSPFLPDDTLVDAAIQALVHQQLLVTDNDYKQLFWKGFEDGPTSGTIESKSLKLLKDIAGVFDDELGQLDGRRRYFFYCDCPEDDMKSDIPGPNFRTYAFFTGNPNHARIKPMISVETAVVAGFKKSTTDCEDASQPPATQMGSRSGLQNGEKLVSAANHVMNDDPCRMWMYGITIENTKMAVWYFSRSHSMKSEAFDFTEDIRTFIRVFLSFVYATREQMGYDPTVHRIKDKESQYVYEIPTENGTRYFKTVHLLAYRKGLRITGRKTRVWKAVEVKGFEGTAVNEELNGSKGVALKDVWLDEGSTTEKQKLGAIYERLRAIQEEAYAWAPSILQSRLKTAFEDGSYRSYFMEIECDSFNLGRSKPTSAKATPAPELLQFEEEDSAISEGVETLFDFDGGKGKSGIDLSRLEEGYPHITEDGLQEASHLKPKLMDKPRSYAVKRQYRLVYSEVGESLERVKTLDAAFAALIDAYIALVLMYLAGWMHRDVSAGNIIAVKRSDGTLGGKLSDLEYGKHYEDENASSDTKTGTAFFMPLEIHTGRPFNRARTTPHYSFEIDPFNNLPPADQAILFQTRATPPPPERAKYRFQHDLESLWWVALYILIHRVAHPPGRVLSKKIFTRNRVPTGARRELFEGAIEWALGKHLHPTLRLDAIVIAMSAIPPILYQSYLTDEPVDPKALGGLYQDVFRYLALLVVTIKTKVPGITFQPI